MKSVWRSLLLACSGALPLSLGLMAVAVGAETPPELLPDAIVSNSPKATETASEEPLSDNAQSAETVDAQSAETVDSPNLSEGELFLETPHTEAAAEETQDTPHAEVTAEETPADTSNSQSPDQDPLQLPLNEVPRNPEVWTRQKLLIRADRFYLAGDLANAEQWYRHAKDPLWNQAGESEPPPDPIADAERLPPGATVYWREALAGIEMGLETRTLVPLSLLVEQYPEFVLGYARYAESLRHYNRPEEATELLQQGLMLYPSQPDLLKAQIDDLISRENWLESSITARQFTIFNPDHPDAAAMAIMAEENLDRFRREMRGQLVDNAIANVITGAVGFALTGGLFGPMTALNSTMMLLQGEQTLGEQVSKQAQKQLPMMRNSRVLAYVNEIGERLAEVAGRDEFDYEFYVVMDEQLNAFALPGGKVFVNAGAIMETHSEAELAGLLAHEMAHAVLSHGFQMATQGNLTASVAQFIPYAGNIVTNLLVSGYSREMERQADILGTQMLSASGYAADGLHNLMMTLEAQSEERSLFSWLSSHPAPDNRVQYLKKLVDQGGYNRFTYEGVERHLAVQLQVRGLMEKYEREGEIERPEEELEEVSQENEEI